MSLRIRLNLIISLLLATGMILGLAFQISQAKQRVAQEVESTARLTYQLLDNLLPTGLRKVPDEAMLRRLLALDDARHLDIFLGQGPEPDPRGRDALAAPAWFARLVRPEPLRFSLPLADGSGRSLIIQTNPGDEISEAWRESKNFLAMLLTVLLALNALLYFTIGRWLAPVTAIVAGLREAEQGNFSGQLRAPMLPELRMITDKLNQLTTVLRKSKAENERLTRRSLTIQEQERRHLAQELHDEMGQSISAIKAIAFSISQRLGEPDGESARGARQIADISSGLRDQVRRMMSRLRPLILDELGLVAALQHMVDDWNNHHARCFCRFQSEGDFGALDDNQRIHLYRIVQEALTNIARHARAGRVEVSLRADESAYRLRISDDGRGFDPRLQSRGMGLPGIEDRVQALKGELTIDSRPGEGARLAISLPRHSTARSACP